MISSPVIDIEDRYEIPLYNKRDIALVRGEGVHIWDADGKIYLDMMSNFGVNILGHAHPVITAAIVEQAGRLTNCHQSFYNDQRAHFLSALEALLPEGLRRLSFSNSGAEAVEAALKFARSATGRQRFVSARRGYHGRTFGAMSVGGDARKDAPFAPLLDGCDQIPFGDLDAAATAAIDAAALIVEPIQGESGVRPAPPDYLAGLRRICDESGTILIFDEIQTALRTGRSFAWQHSGVAPDIMTLSKSLANGLPLGITVVSDDVARAVPPGSHGTTFGGNPLVCAAASATLSVVAKPGFHERVAGVGDHLLTALRAIRHPMVREVRGVGLMAAVELKRNASPVLRQMQNLGVLAIPAGSTSVRFLPPLIVDDEHVKRAAATLQQALEEIDARD
ncbi:MAG: aspartate aminotransferase family protein [Chloroflexota bacterium]